MSKRGKKIIKALLQLTEDLEKGNLDEYRITKVIKNDDGSHTFIEKHKGKIRKTRRKDGE
jgi:hypothetical protein